MAKKKKKKPSEEQGHLPTMEPVINQKVHKAAKWYAKKRDERMALTKVEKEAKDTLIGTMTEQQLDDYTYGDVEVHLDTKKNVKVVIGGHVAEGDGETDE